MKTNTIPANTAAERVFGGVPALPTDPVYAVLSTERETVKAAFLQTKLHALTEANLEALRVWIANDNAETLLALRDSDRALENAGLDDPEGTRLYARLLLLNAQLKAHRQALGLN